MRKPDFAYAKTKSQISFAVTAKLISAFVFATRIVQFLFFLNPKIQASGHLLCLYRTVCVRHGWKPRRPVFLRHGSNCLDSCTFYSLALHYSQVYITNIKFILRNKYFQGVLKKYNTPTFISVISYMYPNPR